MYLHAYSGLYVRVRSQAEGGNVSHSTRGSDQSSCFQKKEEKNSTEAKDNERSMCVKHQQVHIDFSSPSVSVI